MAYYLAVDAGGTKADYLLADDKRVLARVRTASIKRMRVDEEEACDRLHSALVQLEAHSGVSMRAVAHTCVGTAGETVPLVAEWLRREIGRRVGGKLLLLGDLEIALDAAFVGSGGVLVLAGTGSNVAGRGRDGSLTSAGGWGPALADQGSGHRIGQQALRRIFLAQDMGEETALLPAVLDVWGLATAKDLIAFANAVPAPDFSRLVPLVLQGALAGDVSAMEVLEREGEDLAFLVRLVLRRLLAADPDFVPEIAFAGSIMEHVPPVREALVRAVHREFPFVTTRPGVVDPVLGALWRARKQAVSLTGRLGDLDDRKQHQTR